MDLIEFLKDHDYPYEDLLEQFSFRVLLIGLSSNAASTFERLLGSGYTLMIAGNALHAAKLAYVNGVDAVVVDFSIGRSNAKDIVPELPASKHTKLPPLVCGIVGDDEPTPYAVPGYDLLTRAGEEEEIAAKVKAAAKSVIVGTQTHKGA